MGLPTSGVFDGTSQRSTDEWSVIGGAGGLSQSVSPPTPSHLFPRRPDELERPFVCSLCPKVFSTVSSLALHIRLKHVEQVEQLVPLPEGHVSKGAPCTHAGGAKTRLTPADIRSFAIASNWALPIIHTSHRYQKRLQGSAFGRACLWAMVEPLGILTPQGEWYITNIVLECAAFLYFSLPAAPFCTRCPSASG